MSDLEFYEQVVTEKAKGGRPGKDVSSAKRNKCQMIRSVIQNDIPEGSIDEKILRKSTEQENSYKISKKKLLLPH